MNESKVMVYKLSKKFSKDYPASKYTELMFKINRPYACLFIGTDYGYYICIPFRSEIEHKNAFLFKGTKRSEVTPSGLDYSKIVLVKDTDYLDKDNITVDKDEFNQVRKNLNRIVLQAQNYIKEYIDHVTGVKILHKREFDRKYRFSTLKYFHDIMKI